MFNDVSTPLTLLSTRRSARPRDLVEPGPDREALRRILGLAMRTPDHGKLHPWRFVHVAKEQRGALAALLVRAYRAENPNAGRLEIEAAERFAHEAPELVVALSSPTLGHRIPVWEQELSCGAACMNLQHAAHALGFVSGLVTGWAAYSPIVLDAFGAPPERIAGFVFIGTPAIPLEERPRPALDVIAREWEPGM